MNKIAPTYEQFIFEGKYDKLTGLITKEIFTFLKIGYSLYSVGLTEKLGPTDKNGYHSAMLTIDKKIIDTDVFLKFKFTEDISTPGFLIDGGAWKNPAEIEIIIAIDPKQIPQIFSKLNGYIQDTIRHELEHLTQGGANKKPFRPKPTGPKTRDKISVNIGNAYKYFILRDEIPAMCHGMYRKAKIEKIPLDKSFDLYLDYMVDEKIISKKEKEIILSKWFAYSLKKLPAAQYTDKYKHILDKLQK